MNNECMSKHPSKGWFCELDAFHRGDHKVYVGWGANARTHTWPRTNQSIGRRDE